MKIYTFEQTNLQITGVTNTPYSTSDPDIPINIYNMFDIRTTQLYIDQMTLVSIPVPREREGRLDLISIDTYGTSDYVEELMIINNIQNPYSIKEGDMINIASMTSLNQLHKIITTDDSDLKQSLVNSSKNSSLDVNRNKLQPSVKPDGEKQIIVDTQSKIIKIQQ